MEESLNLSGAVSKLTPQDQRELQQFVQNESQKNQIQNCTFTRLYTDPERSFCATMRPATAYNFYSSGPRTDGKMFQTLHYRVNIWREIDE